jgi:hypothetical protein
MAVAKILDESHADSVSVRAIALLKANFITVLLAAFVLRLVLKRYASPLRKYPGPPLASVSRLWKGMLRVGSGIGAGPWTTWADENMAVWSTHSGHTELDHIALHKQYGRWLWKIAFACLRRDRTCCAHSTK